MASALSVGWRGIFEPLRYYVYKTIKKYLGGIDRRPDLAVYDAQGNLVQIYEVARQMANGSLVPREAAKLAQYEMYGLKSLFYLISR